MYSVRVVVVSDTRHVAYYHRYAVRTEAVQLIQLWYTAIRGLTTPCLPSVITTMLGYRGSSLMNKANSAVMSPFRNALSRNFSMLLPLPSSPVPLTMAYQNALLFGERKPDLYPTIGTRADKEICEQPRVRGSRSSGWRSSSSTLRIYCVYTSVAEWLLRLVGRLGEMKSPCLRGETSS